MASEKPEKTQKIPAKRSAAASKPKEEGKKKTPKAPKKSKVASKKTTEAKEERSKETATKVELSPNIKRLLRIRKIKQKQRPHFRKPESWRWGRIPSHWRFPHGIDNKTIRKWKCGVKTPIVGYRGPRLVRGMHPCGLRETVVHNIQEIDDLDPKVYCVKIGARVGARKRISLIEKLREKQFKILNLGMSQKEFEEFQAMLDEKSETEEAIQK
jgi:large subunit ribosomal protein L32e